MITAEETIVEPLLYEHEKRERLQVRVLKRESSPDNRLDLLSLFISWDTGGDIKDERQETFFVAQDKKKFWLRPNYLYEWGPYYSIISKDLKFAYASAPPPGSGYWLDIVKNVSRFVQPEEE
jgi:hypothetical protein